LVEIQSSSSTTVTKGA